MTPAMITYMPCDTEFSAPLWLAAQAMQALITEVELSPKPGLVDRRGSGAHTDLSFELMLRSAYTLGPYFAAMAYSSQTRPLDSDLRALLGAIGRDAEHAMYVATKGINTHKGAIWALGLLVAAAARSNNRGPRQVARVAGSIARLPDRAQPELVSHGDVVRNRYGAMGARAEAWADFPHVSDIGIPALRQARAAGQSESVSQLIALLNIMATLEDTCVLYRAGSEGSELLKRGARWVLAAGGPGTRAGDAALRRLERACLARRISPGGSADLLAATLFLNSIERSPAARNTAPYAEEEGYGTD